MNKQEHLPIIYAMPKQSDQVKKPCGGGDESWKNFTPDLRTVLSGQCKEMKTTMQESFEKFPLSPCVGKVVMKDEFIAKSHKPDGLFKKETCPIVGTERVAEVLIEVTPEGLNRLIEVVDTADKNNAKGDMTKIHEIKAYPISEKIEIQNDAPQTRPIKVKLFEFGNRSSYGASFESHVRSLGLNAEKLNYGSKLRVYKVDGVNEDDVVKLAKHPGVHKISFFPKFVSKPLNVVTAENRLGQLPNRDPEGEYPIVGIIDSGIEPGHKFLEQWIYDRKSYVGDIYKNHKHGTFVGGIVEYGIYLNSLPGVQQQCLILDVNVLPNNDPMHGPVEELSEENLITALYDVVGKYHKKVKVWNMSLGTDRICDDIISDLGQVIDELQTEYGVTFVMPSGNYAVPPLRGWPPDRRLNGSDRITSPADSLMAITVGSVTNEGVFGFVGKNMPSPFSRIGPGANHSIKPDVAYYGGNCKRDLNCKGVGIISFDTEGNLVEDIGTSYSSPAVANMFAWLQNEITEEPVREFSKALLIHSSEVPEETADREDVLNYYGFGIPKGNIEEIVGCTHSAATIVFTGKLHNGSKIEINDFPYPRSLTEGGKCKGNIKMTLVYASPLDPNYGQEYCRTEIGVSLGTYERISKDGRAAGYKKVIPERNGWEEGYESERLKREFKWNLVRSFSKTVNTRSGNKWRLIIDPLARYGVVNVDLEFVLLITISDPKGGDVYSDVIQQLRGSGRLYKEVEISNRTRQRIGLRE